MKNTTMLTYDVLRNAHFLSALRRLCNFPTFCTKTAIKLAKIQRAIETEIDLAQKEFTKLLKKYADLDEKGEIKPIENEPNTYHVPDEKKDEWLKALKEFESITFEAPTSPLTLSELNGCQLSANEFIAIEKMIEEEVLVPEVVAEGTC